MIHFADRREWFWLYPLRVLGTAFYEGHWASFCVYPENNPLIFSTGFSLRGPMARRGGFTNRGDITLSRGWLYQKWKQPDMSDIRPQAPTSTGSGCTAVVTCSLQGLGLSSLFLLSIKSPFALLNLTPRMPYIPSEDFEPGLRARTSS